MGVHHDQELAEDHEVDPNGHQLLEHWQIEWRVVYLVAVDEGVPVQELASSKVHVVQMEENLTDVEAEDFDAVVVTVVALEVVAVVQYVVAG